MLPDLENAICCGMSQAHSHRPWGGGERGRTRRRRDLPGTLNWCLFPLAAGPRCHCKRDLNENRMSSGLAEVSQPIYYRGLNPNIGRLEGLGIPREQVLSLCSLLLLGGRQEKPSFSHTLPALGGPGD